MSGRHLVETVHTYWNDIAQRYSAPQGVSFHHPSDLVLKLKREDLKYSSYMLTLSSPFRACVSGGTRPDRYCTERIKVS